MDRFSPGFPGLASPTGEEPPPRCLGPRAETHTLVSRYSVVRCPYIVGDCSPTQLGESRMTWPSPGPLVARRVKQAPTSCA